MSDLVFLDTETTGLCPHRHQVWEVAYAVNAGPIVTVQLPHSLNHADPVALRLNGYVDRVDPKMVDGRGLSMWKVEDELRGIVEGCHIVGSNPSFDTAFLFARWREQPWHHRRIDVTPMAMIRFGWDRPKGMKDIADALRRQGHDIPAPDHTAAGDVATLRAVYEALTVRWELP